MVRRTTGVANLVEAGSRKEAAQGWRWQWPPPASELVLAPDLRQGGARGRRTRSRSGVARGEGGAGGVGVHARPSALRGEERSREGRGGGVRGASARVGGGA